MVERVVYGTPTFDPETRLPLVVIDSTALPKSPSEYPTDLASQAIERLPQTPHALVFFACGAPNLPSWAWMSKIHAMLSRDVKKRVGKVYIVHEPWWLRASTQVMRASGMVSAKFGDKMVHAATLSELARHVDITQINIPPAVYMYNSTLESRITVPRHHMPVFGVPLQRKGPQVMYPRMWEECCAYLRAVGTSVHNLFQVEERTTVSLILRDAYDRGQTLHLASYGPHNAANVLKLYLQELPTPILPVVYIKTPIQDTADYCVEVYSRLPIVSQKFLFDLVSIFSAMCRHQHNSTDSATLALSMTPTFICHYAGLKENMALGVQFVKTLIDQWPEVMARLVALQTQGQALPLQSAAMRTPSGSSVSSVESLDPLTVLPSDNRDGPKQLTTLKTRSDVCLSSPDHRADRDQALLSEQAPAVATTITTGSPLRRASTITAAHDEPVQLQRRLRKSASTILRSSSGVNEQSDEISPLQRQLPQRHTPRRQDTADEVDIPEGHRRIFTSRTFSDMHTSMRQQQQQQLEGRRASVGGDKVTLLRMARRLSTKRGKMVTELAKLYEDPNVAEQGTEEEGSEKEVNEHEREQQQQQQHAYTVQA